MQSNHILRSTEGTKDINLVAALVAVGIDVETRAMQTPTGVARFYAFSPQTRDGRYKVADLLRGWEQGEEWIKENPEHPFAYLMVGMRIRKELVDGIKQDKPFVPIKRGDALALLRPDCSEETERNLIGRMD